MTHAVGDGVLAGTRGRVERGPDQCHGLPVPLREGTVEQGRDVVGGGDGVSAHDGGEASGTGWAYHACREECSMSVANASVRAWSRPKARSYTAAMVTRAWERAAMGKEGGPEGWATKATAGAKLASGDGEAVRRLSKMVEALGQSRSVVLCQAANSVLARGQQKMRESSTRVRRATNT